MEISVYAYIKYHLRWHISIGFD